MAINLSARLGALLSTTALLVAAGPAALAQGGPGGGQSTPGVIVTAQNPGASSLHSDLRITLTAVTQQSSVANPDCRPPTPNLRCWGSLVLRIPDAGGLSVTGFQVHRVAVGDISCGGCEGDDMGEAAAGPVRDEPDQAQVNGVAVLVNPGTSGYPPGTMVQLKMTLTDNGGAQYGDQADVQVNLFVPGPSKPLIYDTGPQVIQQVRIHSRGSSG